MCWAEEQNRVYRHLLRAEQAALSDRDFETSLSGVRRLARRLLLDELRSYRLARRYPRNLDFRNHRVPYFVDEAGARCAVAHLLEASGRTDLVSKVAQRRNHARVSELLDEPELVQFLSAAGLRPDEAALIQPTYCWYKGYDCFCGGTETAFVEASVLESSADESRVRVDVVHGQDPRADVHVGDELTVGGPFEVGSLLWLRFAWSGTAVTPYALPLVVTANDVTCRYPRTEFARRHVVPKEVAAAALQSGDLEACQRMIQAVDPGWASSVCDESGSGCACSVGPRNAGSYAPEVASFAIVAALVHRLRLRLTARRTATRRGESPTA
ncbi:MAG: hypothetical protein QM756_35065 [Polyangiaceae bacterium]